MTPVLGELIGFTEHMTSLLSSLKIPFHVINDLDRKKRLQFVLDIVNEKKQRCRRHKLTFVFIFYNFTELSVLHFREFLFHVTGDVSRFCSFVFFSV